MLELLLTILIAISVALPIHAQEPTVSEQLKLEEYACNARDPASFKDCIVQAQQIAMPFIKIIAPIICTSRNDCTFEMKNINTSLRISPTSPENKFIRQNDFGYTLLTIENSSNIELSGLGFEDQGSSGCPLGTTCPPFFVIKNSSKIQMDRLSFLKTQGTSLAISESRTISILDSTFKDSFKTGLEVASQNFTQGLKIEGNLFEDNSGSALIYQAQSLNPASSIISNRFINNHSKGAYSSCVYPCTGAQIKIFGPTANLRISNNTISGGVDSAFDSLGLYSSGIEIGGQDVGTTLVYCNEVSSNRGSGIVQSPPFRNTSGVAVSENKIWGNGLNLNIPTVTADENNCFTKECKLSCSN